VLDPVISPGAYQTAVDYRLFSSLFEPAVGTSTAASTFGLNAGFLFFPEVSLPVLTATAGDSQASLSWTAAQGFLGWTVSGYNIGQSGSAGGPYTYTSAGNTLSKTVTGLANNTTYYFVVRVEDIFGASVATSSEASVIPQTTAVLAGAGGGGFFGRLGRLFVFEPCVSRVPGDLNCDGRVDLLDFSIFLAFMTRVGPNPADFNADRVVNFRDLSFLLAGWTGRLITPTLEPAITPSPVATTDRSISAAFQRLGRTTAAVGSILPRPPAAVGGTRPGLWTKFNQFFARAVAGAVDFIASLLNFRR